MDLDACIASIAHIMDHVSTYRHTHHRTLATNGLQHAMNMLVELKEHEERSPPFQLFVWKFGNLPSGGDTSTGGDSGGES